MAVSNVEPVLPQLTAILEVMKYCLPLMLVLLLTWYGYLRAASGFFLIERIWRLIGGGKEFSSDFLNQQWSAVKDLESFRFKTGIRLDSYEQMLELLERIKRHDINIAQLIRGRKYFDANLLVMRNPDLNSWKGRHGTGLVLAMLLMVLSMIAIIPDYAVLTMKKSDITFMVREDSAKSFLSDDWVLKPENCIRPTVRPDDEIKQLVCGVFASEADGRYVRNIIFEQRALSGIFLTLGFWGFVSMIVAGSKAQAARRVFEQFTRRMPASGEKLNPWMRGEPAP
ncbi:DUF6216 family protein [Pseudomonas sp. 14P_8.1_Bac3]|uniref:DUF6216 family protein n=1 Tax=Pseudomonas sp. 14P_8.1_Bac3 TaxID=2971621 RepID=UPI0021CA26CF|nr:DUF6216 family protein [Pseudomonas sp. 14P_8.1_Bac3]MCU1760718.1 DUF6216 family protein [Pseudomonas sp. 14P_8.1_Bac3]